MSGHIFKSGFTVNGEVEAIKVKEQKRQKSLKFCPFLPSLLFLLPFAIQRKKLIL